ncbi:MAG TPA: hypothetical protein VFF20_01085 [Pseudogracilibacillus sp.]|nr:hypothetical protein [Pseudogracilibacillus sp.]
MHGNYLEDEGERYNMAGLTNEELEMLKDFERSMSNEKGEAIVLIAYEQERSMK